MAAPHTAEQTRRLDDLHYMFRCYLGANIIAPIHEPLTVLDVGTGSGRWAIEAATEYPTAEVIGLDISITSPNFPTPKELPIRGGGFDKRALRICRRQLRPCTFSVRTLLTL